jgi:micrococcal nuclease
MPRQGHPRLSLSRLPVAAAVVFLLATLVAACGGDNEDEPGPIARVTQVVVTNETPAAASPTRETAPTAAATSPPTPVPTPVPRTYIVQAGDTLTGICRNEAADVEEGSCVTQTVQLNGLANPSQITVGQELLLPVPSNQAGAGPSGPSGPTTGTAGGTGANPPAGGGTGVAPGNGAGFAGTAVVTRVVDGDTLEVDIGGPVLVRLLGIDTPEGLAQPPVCYGPEASAYTRQLVEGQTVTLEIDTRDADNAGRILRYVYLPNGAMLNELLLQNGFAQVVVLPPDVRYLSRFLAAAKAARDAGLGMWSVC